MDPLQIEQLHKGLFAKIALDYSNAACIALWASHFMLPVTECLIWSQVTDYFAMLPLETKARRQVACVWSKPLSKVNSLYFILKYMPALHLPSLLLQGVALSIPMEMCQPLFIANSVIIPFILLAVLFLRIHVLGQSKPLTIYLVAHYIISNFAIFALSAKFYTTVEAAPFRPRERFGCTSLIADGNFTSIIYAIILFNELVMAFLTLFLAYRKYMASSSTPIMRIFRRDGTFYFITLAVISTANILVNRLHPDSIPSSLPCRSPSSHPETLLDRNTGQDPIYPPQCLHNQDDPSPSDDHKAKRTS
ncbi:hypothetical protein CC1G_03220 [Coprinopsis cinerea okayama7|uniref:Uncharacterized protein n=1 Tax=Coprinopsis cinerea (strain Okayama-7 / 130 / ATCC MYA-4618 / FGSC 9003) TaxID=240176 RepID=A8N777_COPC7|nr:hypothetical protein CC1G_03220 [Coprinopsis cinerea okayama7\|eukprot:XP_001830683.2 hypothetical protein CC1G_03220 [Coprinopsis cinerea okayama7\